MLAVEVEAPDLTEGHAELLYDFRDGGEANGWLHALMRYEHRATGHAAETSFGAHVFNTAMTYKDEPQSYSGPPPGLTTRLFLKLGDGDFGDRGRRSFGCLIYPASAPWHARSRTALILHDSTGRPIAEREIAIACSGSATVRPHEMFGDALLEQAGPRGYVLIRDATCRLFGYHGLEGADGAFSLDHMFGFLSRAVGSSKSHEKPCTGATHRLAPLAIVTPALHFRRPDHRTASDARAAISPDDSFVMPE